MITYNDIEIEVGKNMTRVSFSIYTSNNYEPIHHKANFMEEVYGEKSKKIALLQDKIVALEKRLRVPKRRVKKKLIIVNLKAQAIQEKVCDCFGVPLVALSGKARFKSIVMARHIAMYLCKQEGFSYPEIGEVFNRDHATVHHAVKKIEAELKVDKNLKRIIEEVNDES